MSPFPWLRSARIRRGIALSAVVLSMGGLVLYKSSAYAGGGDGLAELVAGKSSATFAGPGAHGMISMSHTFVGPSQRTFYADVRMVADQVKAEETIRAPLSLAVVLDTSGSMSGEKIEEARRAVIRLVNEMNDDDQISVVRYSDDAEVIQSLARVGDVRSALKSRIERLDTGGGTNIPSGLRRGLKALDDSTKGRVRRIVLVSDGLDSTRAQAEILARNSFNEGITVSSLGIGLDFDEGYMGSLAQNGHGNFAFAKDGASIASFLHRELLETGTTTIENAKIAIKLPEGVRFVSSTGADATVRDGVLELAFGSLFAGDQRRAVLELTADGPNHFRFEETAHWTQVGGTSRTASANPLALGWTTDDAQIDRGRDGSVFATAASALASKKQLEAAAAYSSGDLKRAQAITEENEKNIRAAIAAAPAPAKASLGSQARAYDEMGKDFAAHAPSSDKGKSAAKAAAAREQSNVGRQTW